MGYDSQYIDKKLEDKTSYLYTLYKKLELLPQPNTNLFLKKKRASKSPEHTWKRNFNQLTFKWSNFIKYKLIDQDYFQ
jgi:hypothetical protein